MSTNFMYIPETGIFIKPAKLDAQKHWEITVEMKSFILIAGLWQGLFACQRQIRTKRWRIHKSYFLFYITWHKMGSIYLSDEGLYAVVNFIEKINICIFFYTYIRAGLSLLGLEVPAQKLTRLEHWWICCSLLHKY